jgi:acyl-[acyl-carrier-protein]-phospholipid O-acyltransferase / long-chain-fatty-acid--[acyl-carrier-protein] ligase
MNKILPTLLHQRRFLPLFATQFLGAFNDNLFKTSLVLMITFHLAADAPIGPEILVNLAQGLFILPFFLFSAVAGQLADKCEKTYLIRLVKFAELLIMGLAVFALLSESITALVVVLFLLGTQSTFFGPLKYAILPDHLQENELIEANALIEFGTFVAILLGTIVAGVVVSSSIGIVFVATFVVLIASIGLGVTAFIPPAPAADPSLKIRLNPFVETWQMIKYATENSTIFLAILGISWFWALGATFLAQFPGFAKHIISADHQVVTLFLTLFSLGIGSGSFLCHKLLEGEVSPRYVPLGALGISIFTIDLVFTSTTLQQQIQQGQLVTLVEFLSRWHGWRLSLDLFLIALCGGFYIVPLYALIQARSESSHRARVIAANNILNACLMVAASVIVSLAYVAGFDISDIFIGLTIAHTAVALYICKILPHEVLKAAGRWIASFLFRTEVAGLEHYRRAGESAVIVVNHTSYLDAPLLGAFLPDLPLFAINTYVARKWWVRPAKLLYDILPVDTRNPMAIRRMVNEVQNGKKLIIFPEGRITVTGSLMKVHEGPAMIAALAQVPIVPIRIEGAQYSFFSKLGGKVARRFFPKITVQVLPPYRFNVSQDLPRRVRRQRAGQYLYDIMTRLLYDTSPIQETLFESLCKARCTHGGTKPVLVDPEWKPVTYNKLIASSLALGSLFSSETIRGAAVGILMPNSAAGMMIFFGLQACGRVPAMLNFSLGHEAIVQCCMKAGIKMVYTSRRFIEAARLQDLISLLEMDLTVRYLEDVVKDIPLWKRLESILRIPWAKRTQRNWVRNITPDQPAVILFTSGTEGAPKGVVLSHENLQANRFQIASRIDFNSTDKLFNALPYFHSFGLTVGTLLPILSGMRVFLYPSPLHYRVIPELVYESDATIMFGTDTFLRGYAKGAHPYDFHHVRLVFSGAEPLQESTRQLWAEKCGLRVLEGYGVTEASPVLALNTPMHYKKGSVGRFVPALEYRLEAVEGVHKGGRLFVKGPNIMQGYLTQPDGGLRWSPLEEGWYDTGDIVEVDEEGYVFIRGRAKRFAKIGGEMVSLAAVERLVFELWPEQNHAVVALADERKGEQLILCTDRKNAEKQELREFFQRRNAPELMIPRVIVSTEDKLPLLGTGKVDFRQVMELVHRHHKIDT